MGRTPSQRQWGLCPAGPGATAKLFSWPPLSPGACTPLSQPLFCPKAGRGHVLATSLPPLLRARQRRGQAARGQVIEAWLGPLFPHPPGQSPWPWARKRTLILVILRRFDNTLAAAWSYSLAVCRNLPGPPPRRQSRGFGVSQCPEAVHLLGGGRGPRPQGHRSPPSPQLPVRLLTGEPPSHS